MFEGRFNMLKAGVTYIKQTQAIPMGWVGGSGFAWWWGPVGVGFSFSFRRMKGLARRLVSNQEISCCDVIRCAKLRLVAIHERTTHASGVHNSSVIGIPKIEP